MTRNKHMRRLFTVTAPLLLGATRLWAQAPPEPQPIPPALGLLGILFGLFSMAIPLIVIAMQVICAVHVLRTGRDFWWLFLILFFPLVGSIIYFFVEMYPGLKRKQFGGSAYGASSARKRIRELEEMMPYSDTVENRSELAGAYLETENYDRAIELYTSCLEGLYKTDPHILYGLARAYFGVGRHREALEAVSKTFKSDTQDYYNERLLLKGKALEALNRHQEALEVYADVAGRLSGLEGRYRYARLLETSGDQAAAKKQYLTLVADAKRMGSRARRREKPWIKGAQERLSEMG